MAEAKAAGRGAELLRCRARPPLLDGTRGQRQGDGMRGVLEVLGNPPAALLFSLLLAVWPPGRSGRVMLSLIV